MRKHRDALQATSTRRYVPADLYARGPAGLGRGGRARRGARLPQRAGDRARADRHHRLHDGLRHDRHRARHRARQVQEARRRRPDEDRQHRRCPRRSPGSATPTAQVKAIVDYIDENETIEGAPHLKEKHLPVFDCAFKPAKGQRVDPLHGPHQDDGRRAAVHLRARSPRRSTCRRTRRVEDIMQAYIEAWRLGVKAIAIYRDGSKRTQPLNTSKDARSRRRGARRPRAGRSPCAGSCPTSGRRSRTSSTSPATRATSPSASTRTGRRARSSS